jgi:DNA polymerase-3 subunit delta'
MHPWNEPILESIKARAQSLPHALLIHGPRGVGKLALAERIAQFLLCEATSGQKPCGSCDGCRWYRGGNHPDFRRLEPEALALQQGALASQQAALQQDADVEEEDGVEKTASAGRKKPSNEIKVDQVRALADFLNVGSHRGGRRVALVHPAEEMNPNAANALLKGLEEPPGGAMFLLVSHRPARLLPTLRSRCVAVPVPVPPRAAALEWLAGQGIKTSDRWLAYAGGAPLRALDYAESGETVERLLGSIRARAQLLIDDRRELEALAEALQKYALDRALSAFGAPEMFRTGGERVQAGRAWLAYARQMGRNRALARHPLNPKLFAAEMLATMPGTGR